MAELQIDKMLTISTSHVTSKTCNEWLGGPDRSISAYPKGEYGWFIYTDGDNKDLPNDLLLCVQFAREHGADWLVLDCDGDQVDGLVIFDW